MNWYRGFEDFVRERAPLDRLTTYKVGGPAEFLAEPPDAWALGALLRRATSENIHIRFLGHGTNLLVADRGVGGLVVRLSRNGFGFVSREEGALRVGAAHSLPALVNWSVTQGLTGLECLQGVPGTVGAALRMNAGGVHGEICSSVTAVRGFERDGRPFRFDERDCGFVYRNSALQGKIITDCDLELAEGNPVESRLMMRDIQLKKCATQPVSARSAGCVFKNPKQTGVPPAGKLIDDLGLKGLRTGGVSVSTLHANFLVCEGAARASEIAELIRTIRDRALRERGVHLEMEVEAWGFEPEELVPRGWTAA